MRALLFVSAMAAALIVLAGCGGSGSGAAVATSGGAPSQFSEVGSARFTVDSVSGIVTVAPINSDSRAAFGGSSVGLASSVLLSEGSPERRVLKVTLSNFTKEVIGANGSFRVLFSGFRNDNSPITDLRSTVRTSTIVGNGTAATVFGPLASAKVEAPKSVAFDPATGDVFCASTSLGVVRSGVFTRFCPLNFNAVALGPGAKFGATGTAIYLINDGEGATSMSGLEGTSERRDGSFSAAMFSDIRDVYVQSCRSQSDFSLLVADGDAIRKVSITPDDPAGTVSTLFSDMTFLPLGGFRGVTEKDGVIYATVGSMVKIWRDPSSIVTLGEAGEGYLDGAQSTAKFSSTLGDLDFVDGALYVADQGNNRVRQLALIPGSSPLSPGAWWISTLSGSGAAGGTDGTGTMTHDHPIGVCRGNGNELFVADTGGHRLRKITPVSGRFSVGHGDSTPAPAELATLANPTGFAPSQPKSAPYIQEDKSVPAGSAIELKEWQFNLPEGLKAFSFVVTIEAETEVPGVLPAIANTSTGRSGSPNVVVRGFAGRPGTGYVDGPLSQAAFNRIADITSTRDGVIYAADFDNNAIRRIDSEGSVTTIAGGGSPGATVDGTFGAGQIFSPTGICCSPGGDRIYFTQNDGVVRVAVLTAGSNPALRTSWSLTTIAGSSFDYGIMDDTSGRDARFHDLWDLIYVSATTLYSIEDGRIRTLNRIADSESLDSYVVHTLAGTHGVLGYRDGTGGDASFNTPTTGALTPNGDLLVADMFNHRIRKVTPTGVTTTLCGRGVRGYIDSPSGMYAMFDDPVGIAVEPSGYAYVFELNNSVIRRVSPSGSVATVAGTFGAVGSTDGLGSAALFHPSYYSSLCVTQGGDLLVAEDGRIRLVQRLIQN